MRDRLYVEDNVRALLLLLERGEKGEAYNIQADNHARTSRRRATILDLLDKPYDLIRFVEDRAGHDACYYMDWSKLRALGWQPEHDFDAAMERTVRWYAEHASGGSRSSPASSAATTSGSTASAWRNARPYVTS